MTEFYAQPHSTEHTGFYFNSIDEFEAGMEKLNQKGCEEVEIQFIDGDDYLADLANTAHIGQGDINTWFEDLEYLDESETIQLIFLLGLGYSLNDAMERCEDVCLFNGSAKDYAYDLINETTEIPDNLRCYIDYDAIARDMKFNGEIFEINHDLIITNVHEF